MCENYLFLHARDTIIDILQDPNEDHHFSLNIKLADLSENNGLLAVALLQKPEQSFEEWNDALKSAQNRVILESSLPNLTFKRNVHFRLYYFPIDPAFNRHRTIFPRNEDADELLQITGTVIRITTPKVLETKRQYMCSKCKHPIIVRAVYDLKYIIEPPKSCTNPEGCTGTTMFQNGDLDTEFCTDYQEIKMQEMVRALNVGSMPNSMWVTLEDDLVNLCKPGDNITVCGILKRRWNPLFPGHRTEIELTLKANHITVNNNHSAEIIKPDMNDMFSNFWKTYSNNPLGARDIIVKSICPEICGLYLVKLAVAVVLAGGCSDCNHKVRSQSHLLMIGDPGTGKSQLLRFASKIISRSVLTTGVGSTAAGLTVTAIMENGEWQLEGGALVLSDGGICCIDEFNSMKEHDRTSIHEAMEQQTISVAKAGMVCKLSTRCSILAATNPKGDLDLSKPISLNVALASPLLSRFDLIFIIKDKITEQRDNYIADYILNSPINCGKVTDDLNWGIDILQSYFINIKNIHPVLTEESNRILSAYYQAQRSKNTQNKSRITVRLLESLVRISQGHARLMFHKEVQTMDATVAVMLCESSMALDVSIFEFSLDVLEDFPQDPSQRYKQTAKVILERLGLEDLLEKEMRRVENDYQSQNDHSIELSCNLSEIRREQTVQNQNVLRDFEERELNQNYTQNNEIKTSSQKSELPVEKNQESEDSGLGNCTHITSFEPVQLSPEKPIKKSFIPVDSNRKGNEENSIRATQISNLPNTGKNIEQLSNKRTSGREKLSAKSPMRTFREKFTFVPRETTEPVAKAINVEKQIPVKNIDANSKEKPANKLHSTENMKTKLKPPKFQFKRQKIEPTKFHNIFESQDEDIDLEV